MIYEVLGTGKENARTSKEIAKELNITPREVMENVREERFCGFPICANSKGYYIARDYSELEETIKKLYAMARETKSIADAMNKFFK